MLIGLRRAAPRPARPAGPPGSAEAMAQLVEIMREQEAARDGRLRAELYRGGLARRLLGERELAAALRRIRAAAAGARARDDAHLCRRRARQRRLVDRLDRLRLRRGRPGHRDPAEQHARRVRPHVDRRDPAARRPVHERDGAHDRAARAAGRGSSSAAPARCGCAGRSCRSSSTSSGTGSASRRRSSAPRVHVDERTSTCEGGADPDEVDRLESCGYELARWRRRNLFFGGAPGWSCGEDGTLAAAGDPRRGGHGVVVE